MSLQNVQPGNARAARRRVNLLLFGIDSEQSIKTGPDGKPIVR